MVEPKKTKKKTKKTIAVLSEPLFVISVLRLIILKARPKIILIKYSLSINSSIFTNSFSTKYLYSFVGLALLNSVLNLIIILMRLILLSIKTLMSPLLIFEYSIPLYVVLSFEFRLIYEYSNKNL